MKNDLIKKPNVETEYTHQQIVELRKCSADPIYFMKTYMKVMHPTKGAINFDMFPYQERCVKAFVENRWVTVLAGRQLGKTTVIAAFLLWFACFKFEKYVLVASKDNDASIDVMDRIRYGYEELPMWLKPGCVYFNRHEIVFDNKSSIKSSATTEGTGRGRSVSLLMLDELAFVNPQIQEAMWASLAPTLATGGSCIVSSTPNGDQELFSQLWRGANTAHDKVGDNGFFPVAVAWDEHPDRNEAYRQAMIAKVGLAKWEQEFECKFLSSDPLLINSLVLNRLKGIPPIFEDSGFKWWYQISPKKTYLIGLDVSEGLGQDYSVIQVFEASTLTQVAEFRESSYSESQLYDKLKWLFEYILKRKDTAGNKPGILWSFENNACGKVISTLYYNDEKFPEEAELISVGNKLGMNTSSATKSEASSLFKRLVEGVNTMAICSEDLITELKSYVQNGKSGTYAAQGGATDDLISACLIISRLVKHAASFDDETFDRLYRGKGAMQPLAQDEVFVYDEQKAEDEPMAFIF